MQSRVLGSAAWMMAATALIAVGSSSKKEDSKEQVTASAAKEEPSKQLPATVSSPPPTGLWKALEDKSGAAPVALTISLWDYSSPADIKKVADSAPQGDLKATIRSFDSHGGMEVGQQFETQDGKTTWTGRMWHPRFVIARQSADAWKITMVSGSPFMEEEKTTPQDVGFIELTVPAKGEGGSARLYMSTQIAYEKGQLVSKAPESEGKVLRVTSFVPSEKPK
jgi:hypothetical protein